MCTGPVLPLRIAQGVFAVIVLGLSASVMNWYNGITLTSSPPQFNFLVFVPVFSILSLAYLEVVPRFMPRFANPWATLAVETTNVVFYFAGFVALAVFLTRLLFCHGAVCAAARADTVFASFSFCLWAATAGLLLRDMIRGGGAHRRGPAPAAPGPQMKEAAMAA